MISEINEISKIFIKLRCGIGIGKSFIKFSNSFINSYKTCKYTDMQLGLYIWQRYHFLYWNWGVKQIN